MTSSDLPRVYTAIELRWMIRIIMTLTVIASVSLAVNLFFVLRPR